MNDYLLPIMVLVLVLGALRTILSGPKAVKDNNKIDELMYSKETYENDEEFERRIWK